MLSIINVIWGLGAGLVYGFNIEFIQNAEVNICPSRHKHNAILYAYFTNRMSSEEPLAAI